MTKRKASFYGVRVGKQPGVYDNWEVCKIQVLGFPGSKYKGFQTRAEAENYVNDTLPGSQVSAISSPVIIQTQAIANFDEKHRHPLPTTAIAKEIMCHGSFKEVNLSKKEITSPSRKVTASKEEVTSPSQPLIKDPSEYYKVAMEDDEFVYFKDENDLKQFLEPYFEDAKQRTVSQTTPYSKCLSALGLRHKELQRPLAEREPIELVVTTGVYQLEFDGASKGNPGRAGAGALIRCPHGSVVMELTEFLGSETNNVAEYRALILGLRAALSKNIRRVRAQGDSKLVCLQVTGAWKVENKRLISLHEEVKTLEVLFEVFTIAHIRREYNSEADALANKAVNLGEPVREVVKSQPGCCLSSS